MADTERVGEGKEPVSETTECFLCGRAPRPGSRVCDSCAAAYGVDRPAAPVDEVRGDGPLRLKTSPPAPVRIPLPPQIVEAAPTVATPAATASVASKPAPVRQPNPQATQPKQAPVATVAQVAALDAASAQAALVRETAALAAEVSPVPGAQTSAAAKIAARGAQSQGSQSQGAETVAQTIACASCGTTIEGDATEFSFCTHCGADLPHAAEKRSARAQAAKVERGKSESKRAERETARREGGRDIKAQVRKINDVHQQTAAHQQTIAQAASAAERREINPTVHAALSFFFPGIGQLLNAQAGKGLFLLIAGFLAITLFRLELFGIPMLIVRVLIAIDAYRIAERRRAGAAVSESEWDLIA